LQKKKKKQGIIVLVAEKGKKKKQNKVKYINQVVDFLFLPFQEVTAITILNSQ